MPEAYNYATRLRKLGKERRRLTEQLQAFIVLVADEITKEVDAGTRVTVEGVGGLSVVEVSTNVDTRKVLKIGTPEKSALLLGNTLNIMCEPDTDFLVYDEPHARLHASTREEYLRVANHLPEVMQAFELDQEKIIETLREVFDFLTQIAWDNEFFQTPHR